MTQLTQIRTRISEEPISNPYLRHLRMNLSLPQLREQTVAVRAAEGADEDDGGERQPEDIGRERPGKAVPREGAMQEDAAHAFEDVIRGHELCNRAQRLGQHAFWVEDG